VGKELKNLLVNHLHERSLQALAGRYLGGRLVDIGCGTKPYRDLLAAHVQEHIGVDHPGTPHDRSRVDLLATAYRVPVREGVFDSALCTAVLEHLEEPERAIRECHRVLREGGIALYSVPFIWHIHEEPRDFYRYTSHGLRYLFEKAGFELVEVKALSGFWATFGQMLVYNLYRFNRGPLRWLGLIHALGLWVQGVAYVLDRLDRTERWTWMYHVVARKPSGNGNGSPGA
jgi:SAM-dependent methyltransferase